MTSSNGTCFLKILTEAEQSLENLKDKCNISGNKKTLIGDRKKCIICGQIRMNYDSTGATCGQEKCLQELGHMANEFEIYRKELKKEMAREIDYASKLKNNILEIAKILGIDNPEENIEDTCEEIQGLCLKALVVSKRLIMLEKQVS